MVDVCPTPNKRRFATSDGARSIIHATAEVPLTPYLCRPGCGWWHLTSRSGARPAATPEVVQELLGMDDVAFRVVACDDAKNQSNSEYSAALREKTLLDRWLKAIGVSMFDLQQQLTMRKDEGETEWRRKALVFRQRLDERRLECIAIIAENKKRARRTTKLEARRERTPSERRGIAGDRALQRLREAHQVEFALYLLEECRTLDTDPPQWVLDLANESQTEMGEVEGA